MQKKRQITKLASFNVYFDLQNLISNYAQKMLDVAAMSPVSHIPVSKPVTHLFRRGLALISSIARSSLSVPSLVLVLMHCHFLDILEFGF